MNSSLYTPDEQQAISKVDLIRFSAYARNRRKVSSLSPSPSKGDLTKSTENLDKLGRLSPLSILEERIKEKQKEKNEIYSKMYIDLMSTMKYYDDEIMNLCKEQDLLLTSVDSPTSVTSQEPEFVL
jgi:hypothetical protein